MANCRNCETPLMGKYCHACGQSADDYHRNIFLLFWEIIKELVNFDSRLWRTIPTLFFKPGALVRAQLSGKIRSHVPPFRLFVISLVILVLSFQVSINNLINSARPQKTETVNSATSNNIGDSDFSNPTNELGSVDLRPIGQDFKKFIEEGDSDLAQNIAKSNSDAPWFRDAVANAIRNPKVYLLSVFEWTQRLAILLLPITTLFLGLMYFWRREIFLFDHALVALSMISFVFLMISLCLWLPSPIGWTLYFFSFLLIPVNFYFIFRKGYQSSVIGSLARTILTSCGIFLVFLALIVSVIALAGIA